MVAMQTILVSFANRLTSNFWSNNERQQNGCDALEIMTSRADPLSSPEVGSSSTRTCGRAITEASDSYTTFLTPKKCHVEGCPYFIICYVL